MELQILDSDLIPRRLLSNFDSLLWTDRYCGYGDFELVSSDIPDTINKLSGGSYLGLKESEHVMLLEGINIKSDPENGDKLVITGRSLESILNRRIVWDKLILKGNFQASIERLIEWNAIDCANTDRNITRLIFESSTNPIITALTADDQVYGTYLYDTILDLCMRENIGFKITLNASRQFVFNLYSGEDRSYSQLINPFVIFSRGFDNLLSSDYNQSTAGLKTVALVAGEEGVGNQRRSIEVAATAVTDLERREIFVDASGITRNVPDELPLTDEEYDAQLTQKGYEELAAHSVTESFEAKINPTRTYVYGRDFFIGDTVQISDNYGHDQRTQVREVIHYQDKAGSDIYPTFTALV